MPKELPKDYIYYLAMAVVNGSMAYQDAVDGLDNYQGGLQYTLFSYHQLSRFNKIRRLDQRIRELKRNKNI